MSWKQTADAEGTEFEGEPSNATFSDVNIGIEEIDGGAYDIVDGKIVMLADLQQARGEEEEETVEKAPLTDKQERKREASIKRLEAKKALKKQEKQVAAIAAAVAAAEREEQEAEGEDDLDSELGEEWQTLGLHPLLLRAMAKMRFQHPSAIQKLCIPVILNKGKDVLGVSETGSGKTLAYGLPILSALLNLNESAEQGVQCLVVTPTRELAMQVTEHFRNALQCVPLHQRPRVEPIVGGINEEKQERLLDKRPSVVVATMGRLKAFLEDRPHAHLRNMKQSLKFLVLDEADRLSDTMHAHDLQPLLNLLVDVNKQQNKQRQTLLFSATLLNLEDEAKHQHQQPAAGSKKSASTGPIALMEKLGRRGKPEVCEVTKGKLLLQDVVAASTTTPSAIAPSTASSSNKKEEQAVERKQITLPDTITFSLVECTDEDKESFLHYVIDCRMQAAAPNTARSILVFVNTVNATHRLSTTLALSYPDMVIGSLHANMDQTQRFRNLDKFKKQGEKPRLLVCSDVAARGLDIPSVDLVIHYGIPSRVDTFVHRSGRCGRAGKLGHVVSLSSGLEVQRTGKIRNAIAPRKMDAFTPPPVGEKEAPVSMKAVFARVAVCKKLQLLQSAEKGKSYEDNWRKRTAAEAELELSDEDEFGASNGRRGNSEEAQDKRAKVQFEIAKLKNELARIRAGVPSAQPGQHRKGRKRHNQ